MDRKFNVKDERNLTLLMDFYQLTMSNGYFVNGLKDKQVLFEMFYRKNPDNAGFAIVAGLEQLIDYIENLHFEKDDIDYLREQGIFDEGFLKYLEDFKFAGNISAIPEGTVVFPNEPFVSVRGTVIEAQLIETMVLLSMNHQSLIATKANRIVRASKGRGVLDMGARRGQGYDGATIGSRASYIGGAIGTSNVLTGKEYGVPVYGTMAHSWVQLFEDEYKAFATYATTYPGNCVLLVDTYSVLESGVPNAIRVAKEVLAPMGERLKGIRLDSGDIAYLSKESRKMLDEAGLEDCKIIASNSLDENIIESLLNQGAEIDTFGVGERLLTAKSDPVFGGVYKLMAVEEDGEYIPRIKLSENVEKVTNPGDKQIFRFYDRKTNKAIADVLALSHEVIDENKDYTLFHPVHIWKKKKISDFYVKKLQVPVFVDGKCVYEKPSIEEIKEYCKEQVDSLWDEVKRFNNPHTYYVDLSQELWFVKQELLMRFRNGN